MLDSASLPPSSVFGMLPYNTLVVLAGVGLLGAGAGLIGSLAVLRRMALVGDALAHAALPGLCLAFLLLDRRNLPAMLAGAFISGLVGIVVLALLRRWTRIKEDAALGLVLSVFFGAGIVLARLIQNRSTTGSKAGLDSYILGKTAGMLLGDVYLIGVLAVVSMVVVVLLFKELRLTSFDPGFARVQGWPVLALDLLLLGLIALAVVIGLPAVGVVMIAGLLIIPGATARFWTDRLGTLLVLSASIGLATGVLGTFLSASYSQMPAGPVITLVGVGFFVVSAIVAPRRGLVGRWLAQRRFRQQVDQSTLLRLMHEQSATRASGVSPEELLRSRAWRPGTLRRLLARACRHQDAVCQADRFSLTEKGQAKGAEAARQHQLWQRFLTEFPDLAGLARPLDGTPIEEALPPALLQEFTDRLRAADEGASA